MCNIESICPGCGLKLKSTNQDLDTRYYASCACRQLYDEISAFTLSLRDPAFIHQLVVDTYGAQHAGPYVKPITIVFALIGLYLRFEKGYSGREVQKAHMTLGNQHLQWPRFDRPSDKKTVTVLEVRHNVTKENYREILSKWGKSVWDLWVPEHDKVEKLIKMYLKV